MPLVQNNNKNNMYSLLDKNCSHTSTKAMSMGVLPDGYAFSNYLSVLETPIPNAQLENVAWSAWASGYGSYYIAPFWGNPLIKVKYYFQAQKYLLEKYEYKIDVGWVDYDFKQSQYYVPAKAPKYDNIGFKVDIEKSGNKVVITDNLCRMKWNKDISTELLPIVRENLGEYKQFSASIQSYCLDDFTDIPNYFDVMDYVGGDVYISIVVDRSYSNSELRNVYTIYKSIEALKPLSFRVSYSNKTFDVTNTDGQRKINSASDLLNYTR